MRHPITADDLAGLHGLRRAVKDTLISEQPATVLECLGIPGVSRKTTSHLLALGLVSDLEAVQQRGLTRAEQELMWAARRRHGMQ